MAAQHQGGLKPLQPADALALLECWLPHQGQVVLADLQAAAASNPLVLKLQALAEALPEAAADEALGLGRVQLHRGLHAALAIGACTVHALAIFRIIGLGWRRLLKGVLARHARGRRLAGERDGTSAEPFQEEEAIRAPKQL